MPSLDAALSLAKVHAAALAIPKNLHTTPKGAGSKFVSLGARALNATVLVLDVRKHAAGMESAKMLQAIFLKGKGEGKTLRRHAQEACPHRLLAYNNTNNECLHTWTST